MKLRAFNKANDVGTSPSAAIVLFEVMLAVVIVGLALTGFAMVLQQLIEASTAATRDAELRMALRSRTAELSAEHLEYGANTFEYGNGKVVIDQTISSPNLHDDRGLPLGGIYRVEFQVHFKVGKWPPMRSEILAYQP